MSYKKKTRNISSSIRLEVEGNKASEAVADVALRSASMISLIDVAGDAGVSHRLRGVGDVANGAVCMCRKSVESTRCLCVAGCAFGVLLLDVGVVAVYTSRVVVSGAWEGDAHDLRTRVAAQTVLPLGDQLVLGNCELVADRAVDIHHLAGSIKIMTVALVTRLLRGLEYVELDTVAANAFRLLFRVEDVKFMTCSIGHLEPIRVIAGVATFAFLVLDDCNFSDPLGIFEHHLPDVIQAR